MRPETAPKTDEIIRLSDYTPFPFTIREVHLQFKLDPAATRVLARFKVEPKAEGQDLRLDGRALTFVRARINGEDVEAHHLYFDDEGVTIPSQLLPSGPFEWECETEIDPQSNTALEGLYMSKGMFCSQCEAQGFRKITYFPDRPDVMATYRVEIIGSKVSLPVLLSNGEPYAWGDLPGGRHYVRWYDPHPKPSYLFALVAGDLIAHDDEFTTRDGEDVILRIFVRSGDEDKCAYAMDALKRSMKWDEDVYGLAYDLGLFMIVAVDDFNMGAMENKGLNIFNSKYVLASPETATDADYENIESIIAHEYFHNWTGNRITCRDWFQLCLKEGLTVFRDQQFTEDMRSEAVHRIDSISRLRGRQFQEDAGPLAHAVRPEEYIEINNFYTATVYEKGAEVIRMLRTLVGPDVYRQALDLYFHRHDGQACTIEDFATCFEDASGRDLTQFKLWWSQAGTPRVTVEENYNPAMRLFRLTLSQSIPTTPGQSNKQPMHIPFAVGFLSQEGAPLTLSMVNGGTEQTHLLELTGASQTFTFLAPEGAPVTSLLRRFSAPVILEEPHDTDKLILQLGHDPDPFNRWEAGRKLARDALMRMIRRYRAGEEDLGGAQELIDGLDEVLADPELDMEFKALLLGNLPPATELVAQLNKMEQKGDAASLHAATRHLVAQIAIGLKEPLLALLETHPQPEEFSLSPEATATRALRNRINSLLARHVPEIRPLIRAQFANANNMTDSKAALSALQLAEDDTLPEALDGFYQRWKDDFQVRNSWLALQAICSNDGTLERVQALTEHPAFDRTNPNSFRSLIGVFTHNHRHFHNADGSGYRFVTEWLEKMDAVNPQTTARLATVFQNWRDYTTAHQRHAKDAVERLMNRPETSKDLREILSKLLKEPASMK